MTEDVGKSIEPKVVVEGRQAAYTGLLHRLNASVRENKEVTLGLPCTTTSRPSTLQAVWIADMASEEPAGAKDVKKSGATSDASDPTTVHPPTAGFWQSWSTWSVTAADWDILLVSTVIKLLLFPS